MKVRGHTNQRTLVDLSKLGALELVELFPVLLLTYCGAVYDRVATATGLGSPSQIVITNLEDERKLQVLMIHHLRLTVS